MANVTILSWNIETFGPGKLNNANGGALINFIAQVIVNAGANMVQLIEVTNSVAAGVAAQLIAAIDLLNGHVGATNWRPVIVNSIYHHEAYILLYQLGNSFVPIPPNGGGAAALPMNGLTSRTAANLVILFPTRQTKSGGRKPFYAAFRTTDTNHNFSLVSYHVPFGNQTPRGIERVAQVGQITVVNDGANNHNMDSSLISGDFNYDYVGGPITWPYTNLLNLPSHAAATNVKTTLVNNTPPGGYPTSGQYRLNAYDNIFEKNAGNVNGNVVDLIYEATTAPTGSGVLQARAGAFVRGPIQNGGAIVNIPPQDFEDGWHLVRHGVSNHLPIWVTVPI
jgi:hypothetical protein